jgi:hypothetical protein
MIKRIAPVVLIAALLIPAQVTATGADGSLWSCIDLDSTGEPAELPGEESYSARYMGGVKLFDRDNFKGDGRVMCAGNMGEADHILTFSLDAGGEVVSMVGEDWAGHSFDRDIGTRKVNTPPLEEVWLFRNRTESYKVIVFPGCYTQVVLRDYGTASHDKKTGARTLSFRAFDNIEGEDVRFFKVELGPRKDNQADLLEVRTDCFFGDYTTSQAQPVPSFASR